MCIGVAGLELLRVEYRSNETRSSLQHCVLLLQTWSCCVWSTAAMRTARLMCIAVADLELLRVEYRSNETRSSLQHCV